MPKSSAKSNARLRAEALEYAKLVDRFLEPEIFPTVLEAIKHKDTKGFEEICKKLEIPEEQIRTWTATAFAYNPPYYSLKDEPGTKTTKFMTSMQIW
jgi:hypothetical protein